MSYWWERLPGLGSRLLSRLLGTSHELGLRAYQWSEDLSLSLPSITGRSREKRIGVLLSRRWYDESDTENLGRTSFLFITRLPDPFLVAASFEKRIQ